jgi:transcriptional antiterminator RfaH
MENERETIIEDGRPVEWHVAHTRPRSEKKLAQFCTLRGIPPTLPCVPSVHKYRGKTVTFQKPLFPGYVFLELLPSQRDVIRRSDYVANLLEVFDQEVFSQQLSDILLALDSGEDVRLSPAIIEGTPVRILSGPLRGLEGCVERRDGMTRVTLRLDFIGQAASVMMEADQLSPV